MPERLSRASAKGSAAKRNLGPTWSGNPEQVERLACNATLGWRLSLCCRSDERPLQNDVEAHLFGLKQPLGGVLEDVGALHAQEHAALP